MECRTCGGPAHPQTGCQYTETFITCATCTRRFWAWFIQHSNGKGRRTGGPSFYAHVAPFNAVCVDEQ